MTLPNTFQTGVAIRATDLNGNFTNLDTRVTTQETNHTTTTLKLQSANGTNYNITVSNAGVLTVTAA